MDWMVFGFLAAVCFATGIVFGLAPALQVSRTNVNDVLKEGSRGQAGGIRARRFTSVMVVFQIALTLVLLTGAGLMVRRFLNLYRLDLGMDGSRILTMRLNLPDKKYPDAAARGRRGVGDLRLPPAARRRHAAHAGRGRPKETSAQQPTVSTVLVGDRYFATLELSLRRGREFGVRDGTAGFETAIVSERFVARFFPVEDPIGLARQASLGRS